MKMQLLILMLLLMLKLLLRLNATKHNRNAELVARR
jgi:hypothetical protein